MKTREILHLDVLFGLISQVWRLGLPIGAEIFGVGNMVLTSWVFYIGMAVVPIITLVPDLAFKA